MQVRPESIPRYAEPPQEPEYPTCGECAYFRELGHKGACVFEIFQADTFERLAVADLAEADATDEPCRDFKEDR